MTIFAIALSDAAFFFTVENLLKIVIYIYIYLVLSGDKLKIDKHISNHKMYSIRFRMQNKGVESKD